MIFGSPLPFAEAIESRNAKSILPTDFRTKLLDQIPAELRERSFFSAGVTSADFLQQASDKIDEILAGTTNRAAKRAELKKLLDSMGYRPSEEEAGTLTDLSSDSRLNLILDTNLEMAQGYGSWMQGQQESVLDQWPAQELVRVIDSKVKRDWPTRWSEAGGEFFGSRMIALKNDPIWVKISRFGLPYPPFDFNSGMDIDDVDRDEAIELGLIGRDQKIKPQSRGFNEGLEAVLDAAGPILNAVENFFGVKARVTGGILRWLGGTN